MLLPCVIHPQASSLYVKRNSHFQNFKSQKRNSLRLGNYTPWRERGAFLSYGTDTSRIKKNVNYKYLVISTTIKSKILVVILEHFFIKKKNE